MALTSKIGEVVAFLDVACTAVSGCDAASMIEDKCSMLLSVIGRSSPTLSDVTEALKMLQSPACPFSEEQVSRLRVALARTSHPQDVGGGGSRLSVRISARTQEFTCIQEYLSAGEVAR